MEEVELHESGLHDKLVFKDLAAQVVTEFAAVALAWPTALLDDFLFVILSLDSEAPVFEAPILTELLGDALEDRSAQLAGVNGRIACDLAGAYHVFAALPP